MYTGSPKYLYVSTLPLRFGVAVRPELHRRREVLENFPPVAFIVRAAAVALVDHDEVEEVWRVFAEVRRRVARCVLARHERLEDREKDARRSSARGPFLRISSGSTRTSALSSKRRKN